MSDDRPTLTVAELKHKLEIMRPDALVYVTVDERDYRLAYTAHATNALGDAGKFSFVVVGQQ